MNTRFLISPAYLLSIALLVAGAVLSGSRYMLIGWMLFLVGVFLNAMTLVVLTNREQLYTMDAKAVRASRRGLIIAPLWCSAWMRFRLLMMRGEELLIG